MDEVERHRPLRRAYHAVVSTEPARRPEVLESVCRASPELRAELTSLLRHAEHGEVLDRASSAWRGGAADGPPGRIGRYELRRPIGSGGMGTVWLAEQTSPSRTVAVKVLHAAFAAGRQRRRFDLESEILGRLDHPGIARILEAGCEDDRPWFAMELVDGRPIDEHVRAAALGVRERVWLLIDLSEAVAHAHRRGVVHRDLKPANVLVDAAGRVRVLDFGVARASGLAHDGGDQTIAGELVGTVAYMSPEQLDGDRDIDGRSDVFALGVIAFELLAGSRPTELEGEPLSEAIRRRRDDRPIRLRSRAPSLDADLEIIVEKALRPSRCDRYAGADELAADLRRWLDHEPIAARPPSAGSQLRKLAERHRALFAAASMVLVMLVATIAAVGLALIETRDQRNRAIAAVAEADRQRDAARSAGDETRRQRDAYLSVIAFSELDPRRTAALAGTIRGREPVDAMLAHVFAARGRPVDAAALLEDAHRQLTRRYGSGGNTRLAAVPLAVARHASRPPAEARAADRAALEAALAEQPPQPRTLMTAAWLVARVPGHDAATVARAHAAAGRAAEVLGSTWRAQRSVAMAAYRAGEFRACLEAVERSLERQGAGRPELHAIAALALHGLGDPAAAERLERAEALLASPSWRHDPEAGPIVAEAARMLR